MKRLGTIYWLAVLSSVSAVAGPEIFNLWPDSQMPGPAPLVDGEERDLTNPDDKLIAGKRIVKLGHVDVPQAHVFLPPPEKANGSAVVVCPGGGYHILAWDLEGTEVATWLNGLGVAAIVLKYRVPTRPHGEEPVGKLPKKSLGPVMDAQRAISLVRTHAEEWGLKANQIGVLGFSAGGETAALTAAAGGERTYEAIDAIDRETCEADFALLIYPGGLADAKSGTLKPHITVSKDTPPVFLAHAADDRVTCLSSAALFIELKKVGVPAELHIYSTGGHGYGLRRTEKPVTRWTDRAEEWLRGLNPVPSEADPYVDAWNSGKPLPYIENLALQEAYDLQRAWVLRTLDEAGIGGVKGGVVSPGGQKAFAITEPVGAILRAGGRYEARDKPEISLQVFPGLKLETEIGFVIGKQVDQKLESVDQFKDHVSAIIPAVELISGNWQKPNGKLTAEALAAINVSAAGYIVGSPVDPAAIDPKELSLYLAKDGEQLHSAPGRDCWKGPWETGLWLTNFAQRQGINLQPGQVIICGALGQIQPAETGRYRYDAGELGVIEFSVVP
ncbi:MAG: fumarylacetoacetate hydrolase family protein [Verrucomicrobiales bacterium]|nr:fumarylacetoacetate hydrolase family protein [Verrucomicrobiales bacterium]